MDELQQARAEINQVDAEMAALFERRMDAVRQVLEYKRAHGLPVLDTAREKEVIARAVARLRDPSLSEYYTRVLKKMMEVSRDYQSRQLESFRVGYPGVEGAFSHIAASRVYPGRTQRAFTTFEEVFAAVQNGTVDVGVVPFENSYTGEVGEVLDLLWRYDCHIIGRYDLDIRQNLLALPAPDWRISNRSIPTIRRSASANSGCPVTPLRSFPTPTPHWPQSMSASAGTRPRGQSPAPTPPHCTGSRSSRPTSTPAPRM